MSGEATVEIPAPRSSALLTMVTECRLDGAIVIGFAPFATCSGDDAFFNTVQQSMKGAS